MSNPASVKTKKSGDLVKIDAKMHISHFFLVTAKLDHLFPNEHISTILCVYLETPLMIGSGWLFKN